VFYLKVEKKEDMRKKLKKLIGEPDAVEHVAHGNVDSSAPFGISVL
jgi:hypothetical protein